MPLRFSLDARVQDAGRIITFPCLHFALGAPKLVFWGKSPRVKLGNSLRIANLNQAIWFAEQLSPDDLKQNLFVRLFCFKLSDSIAKPGF